MNSAGTKFWIKYLKQHVKIILVLILFSIIFAVVFFLYHFPIKAVLYPTILCALFGLLFLITDYIAAKRRHMELERIPGLDAAMINELPCVRRTEDADYQAIIRSLQAQINALETSSKAGYRDMVEYYTIWAHQIKTPIASMRLHLQNEDTAFSRKLQSDLFRIEQYVEMVMAYLRLDSASSDYCFKEYQVDSLIKQAIKKFSHEFIGRKINIQYEPVERTVITDDKWLSFVLEQIISNALKYTRQGCVKIYMKDSDFLCIEDTGIGIAAEDLPRIFEKGYTGYNGRFDKKASGIGLYLCKRVCDNLGIGISAKSEINKGTVIELNLNQYKLQRE